MLDKRRLPFASLVDLLRRRAAGQPNERAYVFLSDKGNEEAALSFGELEQRASRVAARLIREGQPGDRALLLFPPGLDFIIAYFGCLLAAVIPVPMMLPRRNSLLAIPKTTSGKIQRSLARQMWLQNLFEPVEPA
jgi:acyl-CoA synthetase (AMP-forming)/AMP-acid ligase II